MIKTKSFFVLSQLFSLSLSVLLHPPAPIFEGGLTSRPLTPTHQHSFQGKHIFSTDNMFHRLRLNVKNALKVGENTIEVAFTSKVFEANRRAAACDPVTSRICPNRTRNSCQYVILATTWLDIITTQAHYQLLYPSFQPPLTQTWLPECQLPSN